MQIQEQTRVQSLDILRALIMVLMIFVNDIPGLGETIPHWLHHAAYDEDMLGLSDIVFPGFLFCVGLSIPFALRQRLDRGEGRAACLYHIVERSLALLIMGLFASNSFGMTAESMGLPSHLLKILSVVAFFLIWNKYPRATPKQEKLYNQLKVLGWTILGMLALLYIRKPGADDLVVRTSWMSFSMPAAVKYYIQFTIILLMVAYLLVFRSWKWAYQRYERWIRIAAVLLLYLFLFKGADKQGWVGLRPGWWQILGLIGWTYFYTASLFLLTRFRLVPNLLLALGSLVLAMLSSEGCLGGFQHVIPGNGSFHTLTFAGVVAGLWLQQHGTVADFGKLAKRLGLAAVLCAVGGWFTHRFWIISKLQETAPWVLYCLAISFAALLLLHYCADIRGKAHWFHWVKPAGTATLTCYMLPSVVYALIAWVGMKYPAWACEGLGGIFRSILFAAVIVAFTAALGKLKIQLKI
ncbi:MAG: DUF5009 domain-containing protein [Bacteroidales bacterium]|nr:DUF5009 domain-containing protein [Bacteroidales bacterium]